MAALVLGAAFFCGCIQADAGDEESVGAAEQPIFVDPPTPHGFLFVSDSAFLAPARRIPVRDAVSVNVALGFVESTDGDDDGDDPQ